MGVFDFLWCDFGSLWPPLGCPSAPLRRPGSLVGPLEGSLGALGSLSGALGLPLAVLCDPFGRPGVPVGSLWAPWIAVGRLPDLTQNRSSKCVKIIAKHSFLEFARGARGAPGLPGSGVSKCFSDPTRAGCQDDGDTQIPSHEYT